MLVGRNADAGVGKDYQMTMFGIKSDGTTMNTRSIQKAIDFISESGGDVWCLLSDVI